jgi:hypothetical protein
MAVPILLLAELSGCGVFSSTRVHARVRAALSPCDAEGASVVPLAGATVSMMCPQVIKGDAPSVLGRTDANGELDFTEPPFGRWIHDGCDLLVERAGFAPARFPVAKVCTAYQGNHCVHAEIRAGLLPAGSGPRSCR